MKTSRMVDITEKLNISDIDWDIGAQAGLSDDEKFVLTYFADIESQTIMYMRDLLHTRAVDDPEVIGFLSIWNYEEYFHGYALGKLLEVCGHKLEEDRTAALSRGARLREKLEAWASKMVSKIFEQQFITMYMTWGAIQEFTTHAGYERLRETTDNPVLAELTKRIMKQERVHFSWYYNNAIERLKKYPKHQKFTRRMLKWFWSPVGAGVKTNAEVERLFSELFGAEHAVKLTTEVDGKIDKIPGLQGVNVMTRWFEKNIGPQAVAEKAKQEELPKAA